MNRRARIVACTLLATALAIGIAWPLTAQPAPAASAAARDSLRQVAFLIGSWKGEAITDMGPRGRQVVEQTERVEPQLGGAALVIHGLGKTRAAEGQPERVVHEAFGVVYYDSASSGLKILAIKADGSAATSDLTPVDGAWRWGLPVPGGHVRYTVALKDGQWHERGEHSTDSQTWRPFMEMRLSKQ